MIDVLRSKLELQSDERRAPRPEHDVRRMQFIVVIAVGEIVDIHLKIDMFGQPMLQPSR